MLASGDTVVIYPEPVSDHDDAENHEDLQTTADEDYILKCVHCSETFTRASLLRDHMRANHPDLPVKYQCPKCDDTFPLKSHLDKHLALHSPTSQVCKVCNKTFANVYRLQRHMISHDESTDLRKFKCPTCAKAFKFKHHLKEHIRIHSGEKPFECANCGKRFSHSGSYSSHMNSKKCWVLNMKGKRLDRNAHPENANGMMFRPVGYTSGNVNAPLQSPPPGAYPGQFLKYDARGPMVPTLYSPPSTRAEFVAAYSMLMAGKHLPLPAHHHPPPSLMPSLAPPPLPVPITCPKPSELSSSPASVRSQISPDVNFNTQLFNMALNKASKDLVMKVKEMEEKEGMRKDVKKEAEKEMEVEEEGEKVEGDEKGSTENAVCRHCHNKFNSPVELHQHERYLCKLNKDISQLMPSSIPPPTTTTTTTTSPTTTPDNTSNNCASPGSTISDRSRHATPSSSLCDTATEDEEDEGGNSDRKKYRMRSLISDDQQKVLKAHYRENPRPDKEELVRIATEVGFSKRVVQVWFQNMRARDRRHGKEVPYFPNMARFKPNDSSNNNSTTTTNNNNSSVPTTTATTGLCVPAYIPIVPQVFTTSPLATQSKYSSLRGLPTPTSATGELPLDLSFRRQPPKAHSNSSSPAPSSSPFNCQDQALNLSTKAPSTPIKEEPTSKSEQEVRATESRDVNVGFQHSSIFKYLQQEGLFKNPLKVPKPEDISKLQSTAERLQIASTIRSKLLARKSQSPPLPKPNGLIKEEVKTDDVVADQSERSEEKAASSPGKDSQPEDLDLSGESRLVIDESGLEKEDEDMDNEDEGDDSTDDEDGDDEEDETSDAASKQAFVDQHNLETLATVATLEELKQHLEGGSGKSKRLRRKSRQMESEDFIMDLDDAVSTEDEDGPQRKRRKSWKGHKVDAELGMYACDQCDKMFSKQSSLARHKYEHSGARPFTCEVCDKAFKHKHHLTEHRRLHSGEKPFQCKKCGKRFSHSGSYSQHMNHRYKYCKPSDTEDE